MTTLGGRIRNLRKELKLSQAEFANNLGISRAHLSKLENGQAVPSRPLANLICEAYLVRFAWLVNGDGPMDLDFTRDDRASQKNAYAILQKHLELFLKVHQDISSYTAEAIKEGSRCLIPRFCPPEVLEGLRKIAKIPDDELFSIAGEKLTEWELNPCVRDFNIEE